jgi:hypothetical protein
MKCWLRGCSVRLELAHVFEARYVAQTGFEHPIV